MELREKKVSLHAVTKLLLAPVGPLQFFLDSPGKTHIYCLRQALDLLIQDNRVQTAKVFQRQVKWLEKGLLWADQGWKNVCHFYYRPEQQGSLMWPGASAECQHYYNQIAVNLKKDVAKGMFYLGAALHLVQDMCVPHHAAGALFNGHKEFEKWAQSNWCKYPTARNGRYLKFTHPSQWIEYNAGISKDYFYLVAKDHGCNEQSYGVAAQELLPLTIETTAGFLDFAFKQFGGSN